MRQVRQEIASQARANGLTYKQAERFAYVMSNSEYEAEQENLSNTFDP